MVIAIKEAPMAASSSEQIWLAAGVRTPFAKIDGPLADWGSALLMFSTLL